MPAWAATRAELGQRLAAGVPGGSPGGSGTSAPTGPDAGTRTLAGMTSLDAATAAAPTVDTAWTALLRGAALALVATSALLMAIGRFVGPSLIVLIPGLGLGLGLFLLRRRPRAGAGVLGFFALANFGFHGAIIAIYARIPEGGIAIVVELAGVLAGVLILVSAVPVCRGRVSSPRPRALSAGALAILVAGTAACGTLYLSRGQETPQQGDLVIHNSGLKVDRQELTAAPGRLAFAIRNDDPLFVRSFDIDALDIHLLIPPRTWRRATAEAAPGSYRYFDEITYTDRTAGLLVVR